MLLQFASLEPGHFSEPDEGVLEFLLCALLFVACRYDSLSEQIPFVDPTFS
jgi:hypothetical protein